MKALLSLVFVLSVARLGQSAASDARLADAVEQQQAQTIDRLIIEKEDVNQPQTDGTTALHWATHHDDLALAKRLVALAAQVNVANRYGVTPLSLACTNGNGEIVKLLLEAGANPESTLAGGETVLMTAARTGRVGPVQLLLKYGADPNKKEHQGQTALMWACAEGHAQVVDLLLTKGADFRATLSSGFSPLFFAVRAGHIPVVRRLLDAGADINVVMNPKRAGGKRPRSGTSPLTLAIENGHFELALELVDRGADPNDQRSGYAPLHQLTWVRKPNRGDGPDGDPPPQIRGKLTSLAFARTLVKRGADVNLRLKNGGAGRGRFNPRGATPLLLACKTADVAYVKLLLSLNADPNVTNAEGTTPLMLAAGLCTIAPREEAGTEEEALAVARILLKLGADVNRVNRKGETAMHGAAYKSFPKVVELLAGHGAEIAVWHEAKNKYGWTPLLIAEGHRVGNFKPSFETVAAIHQVLKDNGIKPPPPTPRKKRKGY